MFKKNDRNEVTIPNDPYQSQAQPAPAPSIDVPAREVSVIGPTLVFKGELSANEDLVIEGRIEGKISHQEKNLTVGKQGRVAADIQAQNVEIQGEVIGDVVCDQLVKLSRSAVVSGNIECARIVMDDGAQFDGQVKMKSGKRGGQKAKLKVAESSAPETRVEQGVA